MRRLRLLLPLVLLAGGLAGCSDDASETTGDLAAVEVADAAEGVEPAVTVPAPFATKKSATRVITPGEGDDVAQGEVVTLQYLLLNGRTGDRLDGSDWTAGPTPLVIDDSILPGLRNGLVGQKVGSEVLIAVAPSDGFEEGQAPADSGIKATDTLLFYVDVLDAAQPRAVGEPVTAPPGLPTVALAENGEPTITVPPGTEPPGELVVQPLITGTGPPVVAGQTVVFQYVGAKYGDGSVFDSSWESGRPFTEQIGTGRVISGWDIGIVGLPVGSQVLLIVPPAEGYGAAGQPDAGIAGTDTLVFVVDVLAATGTGTAADAAPAPDGAPEPAPAG